MPLGQANFRLLALSLCSLLAGRLPAAPLGTAISYQGWLSEAGAPATGIYDVRFALWDASTNGTLVGPALTNTALAMTNGLFTAVLDFGAGVFDGNARWLEIAVRTNNGGAFTTLLPRQPLTPSPQALYAPTAGAATSAGSVSAANIAGTLALGQLPGAIVTNNQSDVTLNGVFSGAGTGLTNLEIEATRLPVNTLNKLYSGSPICVLVIGDSLCRYPLNFAKNDLGYRLMARYGTNGYGGNAVLGDGKASPFLVLSTSGNVAAEWTDADRTWLDSDWFRMTNGSKMQWSWGSGDGFIQATTLRVVHFDAPDRGTLTVKTISAANATNTLASIACATATTNIGWTNFDLSPGRYKVLLEATGGDVWLPAPIIWATNAPGVRYGTLSKGGVNDWMDHPTWFQGLPAYDPDLVLYHEISGGDAWINFIKTNQTYWPNADIVIISPYPMVNDLVAPFANESELRLLWAFAKTNRNTSFIDLKRLWGGSLGAITMTNLGLLTWDGTHPSGNNYHLTGQFVARELGLLDAPADAIGANASGVNLSGSFTGNGASLSNLNISATIQTNVTLAGWETLLARAAAPTAQALGASNGALWVSNAVLYFTFTTNGVNAITVKVAGP